MGVDQFHSILVWQLTRQPPRDGDEPLVVAKGPRTNQRRHETRCALEERGDLRLGRFHGELVEVAHLRKLGGSRLPCRGVELELHEVAHRDPVLPVDARHLRLELSITVDGSLVDPGDMHAPPHVEADGGEIVVGRHQPQPSCSRPPRLVDSGCEQSRSCSAPGSLGMNRQRLHLVAVDAIGQEPNRRSTDLRDERRQLQRIQQLSQARGHPRALIPAQEAVGPARVLGGHGANAHAGHRGAQLPR